MSSHTTGFPTLWSNVESYSTALSVIPRQNWSHIPRLLSFQVECRVTVDSAFCCSWWNVNSHSTAHSAVPGRMSSHTRQCYCCSRSKVGSQSTGLSALPGRVSIHNRQRYLMCPDIQPRRALSADECDSTFALEQLKALSSMTRHSTWNRKLCGVTRLSTWKGRKRCRV